jgi:hypothetical protein
VSVREPKRETTNNMKGETMNSDDVQQMNDGLLAGMIARGEGIDMLGDIIQIDETEMAKYLDAPSELWRMKVRADGWTVAVPDADGTDGVLSVWGMTRRMTPGEEVLVLLDPNYPSFVELFEPWSVGMQKALGKAVALGWNDECQEEVQSVHEVKVWRGLSDAPMNAELWVKDAEGRFGLCLHEPNGGWWAVCGEVKEPVAWAWLGELDEDCVEELDEESRVVCRRIAGFWPQKSPSEASDGVRVGEERGRGVQGASTPARSSAANGSL